MSAYNAWLIGWTFPRTWTGMRWPWNYSSISIFGFSLFIGSLLYCSIHNNVEFSLVISHSFYFCSKPHIFAAGSSVREVKVCCDIVSVILLTALSLKIEKLLVIGQAILSWRFLVSKPPIAFGCANIRWVNNAWAWYLNLYLWFLELRWLRNRHWHAEPAKRKLPRQIYW